MPKTAAQQQKLKSLPPDKVSAIQKDGKTYYVFPDVAHNLAYVGGPKEYKPIAKSAGRRKRPKRSSGKKTPNKSSGEVGAPEERGHVDGA